MIIVVEGADNSGKTTIALNLAKRLKAIYVKSENIPPEERFLGQYGMILTSANVYGNGIVISDRHHAVSDPIYGPIVRGWTKLDVDEALAHIRRIDAFVYCRPTEDVITRTMNERKQMAGVAQNAHKLIQAYDKFFAQEFIRTKVWIYDYTKDSEEVLAREIQRYA